MVVRDASRNMKTFEEFLNHLETQDFVEAHFLNDKYDSDAEYTAPRKVTGSNMAVLLRDGAAREINCLNLKIWKEKSTPECLLGLPDYHILTHIRDCVDLKDTVDSGKASQVLIRDLSNCAFFHLLGLVGAFSFPHADHHHTITTAFAENKACEKMWYTYRPLTKDQYKAWVQAKTVAPDTTPYPIYLRQGDLYFQPGGYVHGPYTLAHAFMTGTMHLAAFANHLASMLEQSIIEYANGHVTNEEPAFEFTSKVEKVLQIWRQRSGPYTWGTDAELAVCERLLQVWSRGRRIHFHTYDLQAYKQLESSKDEFCCTCSNGSCTNCVCYKRGQQCGSCKSINYENHM